MNLYPTLIPDWSLGLLEHRTFAGFLMEAAKVILHVRQQPDVRLCHRPQLLRLAGDATGDWMEANYAGALVSHMSGLNAAKLRNLLGFELDYDRLHPLLQEVGAYDISSIMHHLEMGRAGEALRSFLRFQIKLVGETLPYSTWTTLCAQLQADHDRFLGPITKEELANPGIFVPRLVFTSMLLKQPIQIVSNITVQNEKAQRQGL